MHVPDETITVPLDVVPGTSITRINATLEEGFGPPIFELPDASVFAINKTTGLITLRKPLVVASTLQLRVQGIIGSF